MRYLLEGLSTKRLHFRLLDENDFNALIPFFDDERVLDIMNFDRKLSASELCREWFDKIFYRYENDQGGMNALVSIDTGELIGQCGLLIQQIDGVDELEIGYSLLPKFWGSGLATEAAIFCKEQAFLNRYSDSLISIIRPENKRSEAVARKNGMEIEKKSTFHGLPVNIFRISRERRAKGNLSGEMQ